MAHLRSPDSNEIAPGCANKTRGDLSLHNGNYTAQAMGLFTTTKLVNLSGNRIHIRRRKAQPPMPA